MQPNFLSVLLSLPPVIAAQLLVRALGKGNFGHKGRPGKVGGSESSDSNKIIDAMKANLPAASENAVNAPFLLPDGTKLGADSTHTDSLMEIGVMLEDALRVGVIRVKYNGVDVVEGKMTDKQSHTIVDDWLFLRSSDRYVDVRDASGVNIIRNTQFDNDVTPTQLRNYVNRISRTLIGTKKSGNRGHAGRIGKVGGSTVNHSSRVARAVASYRPVTARARVLAAASERAIAKATGGKDLPNNEPMDVVVATAHGTVGIEVKTVTSGVNSKITMHPDSRRRKEQWVKSHHAQGHTVVVDIRGGEPVYYHRDGFGAFRLHTMQPITLLELTHLIQG